MACRDSIPFIIVWAGLATVSLLFAMREFGTRIALQLVRFREATMFKAFPATPKKWTHIETRVERNGVVYAVLCRRCREMGVQPRWPIGTTFSKVRGAFPEPCFHCGVSHASSVQ